MTDTTELKRASFENMIQILVVEQFRPEVSKLEAEARQRINMVVKQISGGDILGTIEFPSVSPFEGATGTMQIRVTFPVTFGAERVRFRSQAIVRGLTNAYGFSGFSMTGDIRNSTEH